MGELEDFFHFFQNYTSVVKISCQFCCMEYFDIHIQWCRIIRMFIIATMFIVILGLVGGDNLRFLSMVTAEVIAAAIWIAGGLLFLIKFSYVIPLWL